MKKLLAYVKGAWWAVLLAPLLMVLEVMMDLQLPTLMSQIVDNGIANGDLAYIGEKGVQMLLCALVGIIGGAGCSLVAAIASMTLGTNLRDGMFRKVQTFSFTELDRLQPSSIITRMTNDVTQVQNLMTQALRMMVRAPMTCIGGIFYAWRLNPRLSVIFVVSLPLMLASALIIMKKVVPLFLKAQKKIDRLNAITRENLLGMRVVKAFTAQATEIERFSDTNDELTQCNIAAQKRMILMFPITTLITNLGVLAVLWFGGRMAIIPSEHMMEAGQIMAFVQYMTQIMMSFMMFVMMASQFSRAQVSAGRINEVLDTESSILSPQDPKPLTDFSVSFENVSFAYNDGTEPVLSDLTFTLPYGQKVGIIGATGSGKSSLVSLIPRLYDTTSGTVRLGGTDVRELALSDLRAHIGVVLQENVLFEGTIAENLRFGDRNADDEQLKEAATVAQAAPFIKGFDGQYEYPLEQRGRNLSGGQRQRMTIARALVRNPEILILDDATSAVDLATEAAIVEGLDRRSGTTILIAQRISTVLNCDQILVLDEGRLIDSGTHDELLNSCVVYRSIAVSQLGEEVLNRG